MDSLMAAIPRAVFCLFLTVALGACGTYVPAIQEIPGGVGDGEALVNAIVRSVHCELKDAVKYVVMKDTETALGWPDRTRAAAWFDKWGVQAALTLTIVEKSEFKPTVSWVPNPITALFTLAGGLDVS